MLHRSGVNQVMSTDRKSNPVQAQGVPYVPVSMHPTLLYVDDNPRASRLLAGVLEDCGFRVIARNDPDEALMLCRRTYFDLALLDYEMPVMNGARLAREIKYLAPDIPVVLISGRKELPPAEMEFVDAHFGFGTDLDDLLWSLRILSRSQTVQTKATGGNLQNHEVYRPERESYWADST
jgi:CheY-like chemotaxis protein